MIEYVLFFSIIGIALLFTYIGLTRDRVGDSLEATVVPLTMTGAGAVNIAPVVAYDAERKKDVQ